MSKRVGAFLGSFDPIHNGHLGVVAMGSRLFDELVVLVGDNPSKAGVPRVFSLEERFDLVAGACPQPNVSVRYLEDSPAEGARRVGASFLLRSVRNLEDCEDELRFAANVRRFDEAMHVVWIHAPAVTSSTRLKELARAGADLAGLCPPNVAERLMAKIGPAPR